MPAPGSLTAVVALEPSNAPDPAAVSGADHHLSGAGAVVFVAFVVAVASVVTFVAVTFIVFVIAVAFDHHLSVGAVIAVAAAVTSDIAAVVVIAVAFDHHLSVDVVIAVAVAGSSMTAAVALDACQ